jgi:hypothetical protein
MMPQTEKLIGYSLRNRLLLGHWTIGDRAVLSQVEPFTLADMPAQLPGASPQLIKKVLAEMKKAGRVGLAGRGCGARWEVTR